ncbi:MAG: MoaD family protein [Clostridiales bacterium]|jgi:molybdopterin synthase sulfur carrier subunit|nr:MoaD family protein [Clostridiales bacterium]
MKIKFFATYRDITKCKEIDISATPDIRALFNLLSDNYGTRMREKLYTPDGQGIGEDAIILVNGRNVLHMGGLDSALKDSDIVSVFPLVAGG